MQVVLEAKGEAQLRNLAQKLTEAGVKHKLWIEQPENYPTCLAFKPSPKSEVAHCTSNAHRQVPLIGTSSTLAFVQPTGAKVVAAGLGFAEAVVDEGLLGPCGAAVAGLRPHAPTRGGGGE
eukprot:363790-Chlamydomonas_euryale.AAC.19